MKNLRINFPTVVICASTILALAVAYVTNSSFLGILVYLVLLLAGIFWPSRKTPAAEQPSPHQLYTEHLRGLLQLQKHWYQLRLNAPFSNLPQPLQDRIILIDVALDQQVYFITTMPPLKITFSDEAQLHHLTEDIRKLNHDMTIYQHANRT